MGIRGSRSIGIGGLALAACLTFTPAASAQDDQGGTLRTAFEGDIAHFDPTVGYDISSSAVERLLYDTLIGYDEGTNLVPMLATSLPAVSEDGLTLTFSLRPDVPFVRKGQIVRTMTADDVVFSLNRLLRPDVTPAPSPVGPAFFSAIEGADAVLAGDAEMASGLKVIDPLTVEITLENPDRTFLSALAMNFGAVIPVEAGYDTAAFDADPWGTGPYWLEEYAVGEGLVLQRNPHYWMEGMPKADTIDMRVLVSPETQFLQAAEGSIDVMGDQLASADYASALADPDLKDRVVETPIVAINYLTMDTATAGNPFADVRIRQAVSHAIDKENQVRLMSGRAVTAGCIFPTELPGFDPTCDPYPYDVERAKALIAEAGSTGFATQLYTDTTDLSGQLARSIAFDLGQIGIDVEVVQQDFDLFLTTISTPGAAPLALAGWYQDFPDPADFIDPILSCASAVEGGANAAFYCNPDIDPAAAEARQVMDITDAIPLYQDIQRRIMADAPLVPLVFPVQTALRSERVPGFTEFHPVWFQDLRSIAVVEP